MRIPFFSFIIKRINWEFWTGNIIVILSTVLGVYLASHAALETGLKFESIRDDVHGYNLRKSMRDEIQYNIETLEKLIKFVKKVDSYNIESPLYPKVRTFVLDAMKRSRMTLTLPNDIISGTLNFYDSVNNQLVLGSRDHARRREMLRALVKYKDQAKKQLLPSLDKDIARLEKKIREEKDTKRASFLSL